MRSWTGTFDDVNGGPVTSAKVTPASGLVSWENLPYGTYRVTESQPGPAGTSAGQRSHAHLHGRRPGGAAPTRFEFNNTPFGKIEVTKDDTSKTDNSGCDVMTLEKTLLGRRPA